MAAWERQRGKKCWTTEKSWRKGKSIHRKSYVCRFLALQTHEHKQQQQKRRKNIFLLFHRIPSICVRVYEWDNGVRMRWAKQCVESIKSTTTGIESLWANGDIMAKIFLMRFSLLTSTWLSIECRICDAVATNSIVRSHSAVLGCLLAVVPTQSHQLMIRCAHVTCG